jgi:uncharacterized protein YndB with AHSA1/START domain
MSNVLAHDRVYDATPQKIWEAFRRPELLAGWWGPQGFTNSFEVFEFREKGHWDLTMTGPTGLKLPNRWRFLELKAPEHLLMEHYAGHYFKLAITLKPEGRAQTRLHWEQIFRTAEEADKVRDVMLKGNQENLERLGALLATVQP